MNAPKPASSGLSDAEHELSRFLRRARAAQRGIATTVHPDLDSAGYAVLIALLELSATQSEGVRAADLGAAMRLHKSTTSRNIAELERLGLIERVPDPSDARARLVRFTDIGEKSLQEVRAARRAKVAETLERWPRDDVRELARLLKQLNNDWA